ncbi:uncharacterized protein L201_003777 [Kwoniella dendrophila CBS 6074]|uniref:Methyltransferase type 11 domain-containing protein n=1 Tax=Kwoniella dendrophila CBS 6074 TaxID=1295534 RepID=A0AAX4JU20_9TREE
MPIRTATDFSSAEYWSKRFENENSFEWLISDEKLLPFIEEYLPSSEGIDERFNILHFGSGTSSLGSSIQNHCKNSNCDNKIQVYDSDYVQTPSSSSSSSSSTSTVPFLLMDILSLKSIKENTPKDINLNKWDLIIDKSTCDAISCGSSLSPSNLFPSKEEEEEEEDEDMISHHEEPVNRLLYNLSKTIIKGGKWLSISYSSNRFHIDNNNNSENRNEGNALMVQQYGWKLIEKKLISTTYLPNGKSIKDFKTGKERIVHEPETGVWLYVLERI